MRERTDREVEKDVGRWKGEGMFTCKGMKSDGDGEGVR